MSMFRLFERGSLLDGLAGSKSADLLWYKQRYAFWRFIVLDFTLVRGSLADGLAGFKSANRLWYKQRCVNILPGFQPAERLYIKHTGLELWHSPLSAHERDTKSTALQQHDLTLRASVACLLLRP